MIYHFSKQITKSNNDSIFWAVPLCAFLEHIHASSQKKPLIKKEQKI